MENIVAGYSDFTGLAKLRVAAQKDQVKAAEEVGRQFEPSFIHSMLTSMRKASEPLKSDLWDSSALNSYETCSTASWLPPFQKRGNGSNEWLVNQVLDSVPNSTKASDRAIRLQLEANAPIPLNGACVVDILSIGSGAVNAYRQALSTTSNNIANVNSPDLLKRALQIGESFPVRKEFLALEAVPKPRPLQSI